MSALPNLVTVEQYWQLPEDPHRCFELHLGEVVTVPWPKMGDVRLRERLAGLLRPKLTPFGEVGEVFPFRVLPEFDLRAADVAAISWPRWHDIDPEDSLYGAPELVVMVITPDAAARELRQMASLCLTSGAIECWLACWRRKSLTVVRRGGSARAYEPGAQIPLDEFGSDSLTVASVFEGNDW